MPKINKKKAIIERSKFQKLIRELIYQDLISEFKKKKKNHGGGFQSGMDDDELEGYNDYDYYDEYDDG